LDTHVFARRYELRAEGRTVVGEAEIQDTAVFSVTRLPGETPTVLERWSVGGWLSFSDGRRLELIEETSSKPGRNEFRFVEARERVAKLHQTKATVWHLQTWAAKHATEHLLTSCALVESLQAVGA
jgi:hypothetical protein